MGKFLFIACLFPYISLVITPFDTQPYALLFSLLIPITLMIKSKDLSIPRKLIPFFLLFVFSLFRAMLDFHSINVLRSLVGYGSVFFISLAGFYSFKYMKGEHFVYAVKIWFFVGIVQNFFNKSFGSEVVARMSTSLDRGVTSLAVEPSYYAIVCVFFMILNDIFFVQKSYNKKTYNFVFLITTLQVVMSKSALGVIIFAIYLVGRFLFIKSMKRKVLGLLAFSIAFMTIVYLFKEVPELQRTRLAYLIELARINPMNLIYLDGSISDRLSHILVSLASLFHSYGLGFGLANFDTQALYIANNSGDFIRSVTRVHFTYGRIMSGWGTSIFEMGLIGLTLPMSFFSIMISGIKRTHNEMKYVYKVSLFTIFLIMMTSVPLSFPLFSYLIGVFVYLQSQDWEEKQNNYEILEGGAII